MKKTLSILFVAALFATALSCSKEIAEPAVAPEEPAVAALEEGLVPMTFCANFSEATKAVINDDGSAVNMTWVAGDKIAVYDGTAVREFTLTEGAGTSNAKFEGLVQKGATDFCAIHPYSVGIGWDSVNSQFTGVVIPENQNPAIGGIDPAALICVASQLDADTFSFTNVLGLLKIDMQQDDFESFEVHASSMNGSAGTIAVKPDGSFSWTARDKIAINIAAAGAKGVYYIGFPAGNYTGGVSIVAHKDGARAVAARATANIAAGNCYTFGTFTGATWLPDVITTEEQLRKFGQVAYYGYLPSETVKLGADIDLDSDVWTPITRFYGTFDGQNHRIYNMVISPAAGNAGFFNTLGNNTEGVYYGNVKNVCFGSSDYDFSLKTGTYDGKSSVTLNTTTDDYCYAAAAVAYASVGTTIDKVYNFVPLTVASTIVSNHRAAGVVGMLKGSGSVTNCVNYAAVVDNSGQGGTESPNSIGGVLAISDGANNAISGCVNNGAITSNAFSGSHIAGVCAYINKLTYITECTNNGAITMAATTTHGVGAGYGIRIGGVVGASYGTGSVIEKCSNTGVLAQNGDSDQSNTAMGGIIGAIGNSTTVKGCTNSGNFGCGVPQTYTFVAGGICGYANDNAIITKATDGTRNTNSGVFTQTADFMNAVTVGGIMGYHNNKTATTDVIEYSDNNAKVQTAKAQVTGSTLTLGGIVGYTRVSVRNCTNNGAVVATSYSNNTEFKIGGIAGVVANYDIEVANCSNTANVQMGKGDSGKMSSGCIAGVFYSTLARMHDCTNTGMNYVSRGNAVFGGALVGQCVLPTDSTLVTTFENCIVNCDHRWSNTSYEKGYVGALIGYLKGTPGAALTVGSALEPVKVLGTYISHDDGSTVATLNTIENITTYAFGKKDVNQTLVTNGDVVLNAVVYVP